MRTTSRKDVERVEISRDAYYHIQKRVWPLIDRDLRHYLRDGVLDAVICSAYLQGAMDALNMADRILPKHKP